MTNTTAATTSTTTDSTAIDWASVLQMPEPVCTHLACRFDRYCVAQAAQATPPSTDPADDPWGWDVPDE